MAFRNGLKIFGTTYDSEDISKIFKCYDNHGFKLHSLNDLFKCLLKHAQQIYRQYSFEDINKNWLNTTTCNV